MFTTRAFCQAGESCPARNCFERNAGAFDHRLPATNLRVANDEISVVHNGLLSFKLFSQPIYENGAGLATPFFPHLPACGHSNRRVVSGLSLASASTSPAAMAAFSMPDQRWPPAVSLGTALASCAVMVSMCCRDVEFYTLASELGNSTSLRPELRPWSHIRADHSQPD